MGVLITMRLDLTIEQHQSLTRYLAKAYSGNYRNNLIDTETFDSMVDVVYDGVNHLTVGDF